MEKKEIKGGGFGLISQKMALPFSSMSFYDHFSLNNNYTIWAPRQK
jgi:hypothetical protein